MPPIDVVLHLDLTPKAQKRGGFKMAAFGRSSTRIFGLHAGTEICAKRTYYEQKDIESGTVHVRLFVISPQPILKNCSTFLIRGRGRRKIWQSKSSAMYGRHAF
jgi:hypothetical protein